MITKAGTSRSAHEFFIKRAYEPSSRGDGARFLVDRLWPRGIAKSNLPIKKWIKEVAPTDVLRKWFAHDTAKWREFRKRYRAELRANPEAWAPLLKAAQRSNVTLLFAAQDTKFNNAAVLKEFLAEKNTNP